MLILVSGATVTVRRLSPHPNLGVLLTPDNWNAIPPPPITWAADNSAFSGFKEDRFLQFLNRIWGSSAEWVSAPDVVGDAKETMALWGPWRDIIRGFDLLPALVAQDGLTARRVPWNEIGAIFIGGTTAYKLSATVVEIVAEANQRGIWAHMGRVNSLKRIVFAGTIGCRSIDGWSFSRYAPRHLPWALRAAHKYSRFQEVT